MLMNEERATILIDRLLIDNPNSNIEANSHQKKSPLLSSSSTSSSTSSANTTPSTSAPNSNSNSLNRSLVNSSNIFNDFFEQFELKEKTRRSRSVISTNRDYYSYKSLNEEYSEAKRLLKEKDEKINKLSEIRNCLESEVHELTASLFEQAYAMVNEAKGEAALSNKLLIEANGKIDVLEAEVKALKTLVTLTNTPTGGICTAVSGATVSTPKHNHLQIPRSSSLLQTSHSSDRLNLNSDSSLLLPNTPTILNNKSNTPSFNRNSFKSHKRTPSHNDVKQAKLTIELDQINNNNNNNNNNIPLTPKCEIYEIDPIYFKEIVLWRENPDLDLNNVFIARVYTEDIQPCISFNNKELTEQLLAAIQSNSVCIEDISNSHPIDTMQVCSLSNIPSICQYKIKFNESSSQWYLISKLCRNRIISVCDFFTYLRYIKDGLVKSDNRDVYWNIIDLRRRMALSRLGL